MSDAVSHGDFGVVVFRADASLEIGTGHVMRCLTLAEALRAQGGECHFLCREHPGHLCEAIEARGFTVHRLPRVSQEGVAVRSDPLPDHAHWLGTTWEQDAEACGRLMAQLSPDWLVVDHYALDARWETAVLTDRTRLMVIDDLADREHACDLLLDQNWFGDESLTRYSTLVPHYCRCLLGPEYALLKPEYALLRALMPPRDGIVRRLLVFLGGSDPTNQTDKVLDALKTGFDELVVDVVIGVNHPDPNSIQEKVASRPLTFLHQGLPSLAGWMARADLMIGAGGSTTWERMCLGLPAIVLSVAPNQNRTNLSLMKSGYIDFLGEMKDVTPELIASAVHRCLANPQALKNRCECTKELVTGKGVEIVSKYILSDG